MPTGHAIHIGLNRLSAADYGQEATLIGAENDARAMDRLSAARGFRTRQLFLAADATIAAVRSAIAGIALERGDLLLLTFSGHGRLIEDTDKEEPIGLDQTWCLFDRMLIDDEIYDLLTRFASGSRVLVISDSCHSGSVIELDFDPRLVKNLPQSAYEFSLAKNHGVYAAARLPREKRKPVHASVILLAACKDGEDARDGDPNSIFTQALLDVWDGGAFSAGLRTFFESIEDRLTPAKQTPQWYQVGVPDVAFDSLPPFSW